MSRNRILACLGFALSFAAFALMTSLEKAIIGSDENVPNDRKIANTETKKENRKVYSKPSDAEIKARLTPLQYRVTQHEDTERPFQNEYWNKTDDGIYLDIVSGEPLFSSRDMYKSGTGWPSFVRALVPENIVEKKDRKFFVTRTEVRSKHGDSHLGHVFNDGPKPTGLRYCMNSASMRFVPVDRLEAEGFGEFATLFKSEK